MRFNGCMNNQQLDIDRSSIYGRDRQMLTYPPMQRNPSANLPTVQRVASAVSSSEIDTQIHLPENVVVGSSATAGVGLSTSLALLAHMLGEIGYRVALVDADLQHGGLDVLLGLEADEGRRLQDVQAPLGRFDGNVLCNELIHWDDVNVLASAPWRGVEVPAWLLKAIVAGLAQACDVVVVDIGAGQYSQHLLQNFPELLKAPMLMSCELSVLGLARFSCYAKSIQAIHQEHAVAMVSTVLGMASRGVRSVSLGVSVSEAVEYLSLDALQVMKHDEHLYRDILQGYGIRRVPSSLHEPIQHLCSWLVGDVESAGRRHYVHRR